MTCGATTCSRPHAADPASAEAPSLRAALRRIAIWRARARQRRALAMLDDTRLRDIGLTPPDPDPQMVLFRAFQAQ